MIQQAARTSIPPPPPAVLSQQMARIEYMRAMVLTGPVGTERFHAMFLDQQRGFIGDEVMGTGGESSLRLRMRDLFGRALAMHASAILIAHNHPSGMCRPSRFDHEATLRIKQVADALDIELVDHLIFTRESVYSMRAGGDL